MNTDATPSSATEQPATPPPLPAETTQNITPAPTSTNNDNTLAMLCHLLTLVGFVVPFGNIIAPLILWLTKKDESPLVDQHGKEALNFQISIGIYTITAVALAFISFLLIFLLIPILILIPAIIILVALPILDLVCTIIAAVQASDGKHYRYPLSIRFFR
ncbi:DUF4870 domain-containing protein [Poriferisphaera sp. WC338]|uniref:DUF4870 domain-containing protein n=1 Tax=Poriferisphaera sp. WC338 TaxID=3425129 RepID=UPI003D81464E